MAQHLRPGRRDNRGGHKPKTSTKIRTSIWIEESQVEALRQEAAKLNASAKDRYTIHVKMQNLNWLNMDFKLTLAEAENELKLRQTEYPSHQYKIEPCSTTEN